ncbi:MMPL family transporter [Corynebacterium heidelbergense]|uniref:SSD domain-containing protein n=1 Tax=Corynebacterium heidelbergense TaxID=2055947 RepID=A0A364V9M4_9CORY|nr:MMPL family transporter [Corynebacterium heidelbergense]RAV33373.1 hypothetical protein CWC39_08855 [Corynebacterium heidelbergense]WCZ35969.1 Membrane protein YdfJ [Corynebacterium heidelbergense]
MTGQQNHSSVARANRARSASGGGQPKRSRWLRVFLPALLILAWLGVFGAGGPQFGVISEVSTNEQSAFLPQSAESTRVQEALGAFLGEDSIPAVVVISTPSGDKPVNAAELQDLPEKLARAVSTTPPTKKDAPARQPKVQASPIIPAKDGHAAQTIVLIPRSTATDAAVENMTEVLHSQLPGGVQGWVTGPAGFVADFTAAFGGIDGILLLVALAAVLVILVVVYRSPVLPILVLLAAMTALCAAVVVNVALARADLLMINGQIQGILFILVIGAATDYCLLYTSRYREELHRHHRPWDATVAAWKATWEPIVASAGTVIAGLLCLMLSDLQSNAGLGPVAAIGIICAVLVSLTFLPAMLLFGGRAAFWPKRPQFIGADHEQNSGVWNRVAGFVRGRPRPIAAGLALLLTLGCGGLFLLDATGVPQSELALGHSQARDGQAVVDEHFPGGSGAPSYITAPEYRAAEVARTVQQQPGVASVSVTATGSPSGSVPVGPDGSPQAGAGPFRGATPTVRGGKELLQVTLRDASDSKAAEDTVVALREALRDVPGADVGGPTAVNLDTNTTSIHDRNIIIPLVLVAITLMLMLLLRSLVAPLVLLATTVLSFGFSLGVSAMVFKLVGFSGSDPSVPLFGFVFLVALGIDYNIFLMTRVREESLRRGTAEGTSRGLITTGGVITSAGVVLAATFAALTVIPIQFMVQLAVIVAFGVLIDALLVRTFLVPALTHVVGDRIWWPARVGQPAEAGEPAYSRTM